MRTVLIGAVESTLRALHAMAACDAVPEAVFTLPLSRSRRHSDFVDLRDAAADAGAPVIETANVNDASTMSELARIRPDVVFVIGWSQICGKEFLDLPAVGSIGFHPSALPENRGRAAIPWTILQDARTTGSSLLWLGDGVDDGDLVAQERFAVAPDETARTLYDKHLDALERMLCLLLTDFREREYPRMPQDHTRATWCARRVAEDGLIDWRAPAEEVWRLIRAVGRPYPGAFTFYDGKKLTIWDAELIGPQPYWALPGQIVRLDAEGVVVQCGDRHHVRVRQAQLDGDEDALLSERVRLHERLGGAR